MTLSRGEGLGLQPFSINFYTKNYTDRSNLAPSPWERVGERSKLNDISNGQVLLNILNGTLNSSSYLGEGNAGYRHSFLVVGEEQ